MIERLWNSILDSMIPCFMPLVCSYYALSTSLFLNVSVQEAPPLEWCGNMLLAPAQFLFVGKEAYRNEDGLWEFSPRFDYRDQFWVKTASSLLALPTSLVLGSLVKGLSFLDPSVRKNHVSLRKTISLSHIRSNLSMYEKVGISTKVQEEFLTPLGNLRRPGDEKHLQAEKGALLEIAQIFNEKKILWWVDCGTCLGTYRYGGVIPWDGDIDIAILAPDFENALRSLNELDRKKYFVQDWSSRDFPNSCIKVFIRKTGTLIDIYHFAIDEAKKEIRYILSLENSLFFPEWWKIRERRFKVPAPFAMVFPLKRGMFDGIEVFVPNDTKAYLQRCYGENLDPVKIYCPESNLYEKDLSHPYWQRAYAH